MEEGFRLLVAEVFEVQPDEVSPEMTPESVELWDSMNHLRLVTAVEERYDIHMSMTDIQDIESIGTLAALVEKYRGTK